MQRRDPHPVCSHGSHVTQGPGALSLENHKSLAGTGVCLGLIACFVPRGSGAWVPSGFTWVFVLLSKFLQHHHASLVANRDGKSGSGAVPWAVGVPLMGSAVPRAVGVPLMRSAVPRAVGVPLTGSAVPSAAHFHVA